MSDVQISVVIPSRHRNDWLARCLECLAPGRQTLDPSEYEVIVTDDGSNTTAESMIRERFSWVKWVSGPRRGPAANRNNGARFARAPWIVFTDDDCIPTQGWLAAYLSASKTGSVVLEGKTVCREGFPSALYEAPVNERGGSLWACNLMFSSDLYRELKGYDESFPFWCEDMEMQNRLQRHGITPLFVPLAEVDHPPRKRALGLKAARNWEARVHLEKVTGASTTGTDSMPLHIIKVRVAKAIGGKWNWGALVMLGSGLVEFVYVLLHIVSWRKKYR